MAIKVVLVRPLYEENVGLAARACANFCCNDLRLVRPECDWKSGKAKSRAMHGSHVLLKAKSFDSIADATKDCAYSIATSARKEGKRNAITLKEAAKRLGKSRANAALVFGPEPSGLTKGEIGECDYVARIPASTKYPTLNLSHAVSIMLYQVFAAGKGENLFREAAAATRRQMLRLFEKDLEMLASIDDRKAVLASFKALTGRALLSEKEAKAFIAFLSETGKGLRKRKRP